MGMRVRTRIPAIERTPGYTPPARGRRWGPTVPREGTVTPRYGPQRKEGSYLVHQVRWGRFKHTRCTLGPLQVPTGHTRYTLGAHQVNAIYTLGRSFGSQSCHFLLFAFAFRQSTPKTALLKNHLSSLSCSTSSHKRICGTHCQFI